MLAVTRFRGVLLRPLGHATAVKLTESAHPHPNRWRAKKASSGLYALIVAAAVTAATTKAPICRMTWMSRGAPMWLPYEATPPYERWPARDVDPKGPAACSIGGLRIVLASLRLVAVAGSLSVMPIFEAPQSTLAWGHFSSMGRRH